MRFVIALLTIALVGSVVTMSQQPDDRRLFALIVEVEDQTVAGTAGPLPYSMNECRVRMAEFTEEHEQTDPEMEGWVDLEFRCLWLVETPELGQAVGDLR